MVLGQGPTRSVELCSLRVPMFFEEDSTVETENRKGLAPQLGDIWRSSCWCFLRYVGRPLRWFQQFAAGIQGSRSSVGKARHGIHSMSGETCRTSCSRTCRAGPWIGRGMSVLGANRRVPAVLLDDGCFHWNSSESAMEGSDDGEDGRPNGRSVRSSPETVFKTAKRLDPPELLRCPRQVFSQRHSIPLAVHVA